MNLPWAFFVELKKPFKFNVASSMTKLYLLTSNYYDGVEYSQLSFQDSGSVTAQGLTFFHDDIMFIIIIIFVIVS